jgi:hypothetical protein
MFYLSRTRARHKEDTYVEQRHVLEHVHVLEQRHKDDLGTRHKEQRHKEQKHKDDREKARTRARPRTRARHKDDKTCFFFHVLEQSTRMAKHVLSSTY